MTQKTRTDAIIASWLAEGPTGPARLSASERDAIAHAAELVAQRRSLIPRWPPRSGRLILVVAVLALVALLSVGAAVGMWLDSQKPPIELSRSTEIDALVLSSYQSFAELPAFKFELHETLPTDDNATVTRYLFDGTVLREEYAGVRLFGADFMADERQLDGGKVWIVSTVANGHPLARLTAWRGGPDCSTGWDLVEVVDVIGRPTRHVRCVTEREGLPSEGHLWIDIETGLPLRSVSRTIPPWPSGTDVVVGAQISEVKNLEFGPQDPALFAISGETMSADEFACATEGTCASPAPSARPGVPPPSSPPFATPRAAPAALEKPTDLTAFVAEAIGRYESSGPLMIGIEPAVSETQIREWRADGAGSFRWVLDHDPSDGSSVPWIITGGRSYEWDPAGGIGDWRDWGVWGPMLPTFGLVAECGLGWTYLGDDLVLDRPAAHLVCGMREFWIDREWLLVTRAHNHDPMVGSDPRAGLSYVTSVTFEPQPAQLFVLPPDQGIYPTY